MKLKKLWRKIKRRLGFGGPTVIEGRNAYIQTGDGEKVPIDNSSLDPDEVEVDELNLDEVDGFVDEEIELSGFMGLNGEQNKIGFKPEERSSGESKQATGGGDNES